MAEYKSVVVSAGSGGFGGPLTLTPDEKRHKIVNITGGVISDVALRLGEMTGAEVVDGFKTSVPEEEILAVVIDCGGTLRCGIYPQKRIFTGTSSRRDPPVRLPSTSRRISTSRRSSRTISHSATARQRLLPRRHPRQLRRHPRRSTIRRRRSPSSPAALWQRSDR